MKLTFVGHASVLFEDGGVAVLTDPWLKGGAFNESWELYPKPVLHDDAFSRVTHIWISHEHPDHLSIPTIRSMPAELKSGITLLFQKHYDTEILDWLKGQGFKEVVEMPHGKWVNLTSDFSAACYQIGHLDSSLALKTPDTTVLNINDCEAPLPTLKRLMRQLGDVDLLLDQFSIAGWPGNPDDVERKKSEARQVLDNFLRDIEVISPRYVIPFASFVRFAHQENAHMNSHVNTIEDVAAAVDPERLMVMYPGDEWDMAQGPFEKSTQAIEKYMKDWEQLPDQELNSNEPVELEKVLSAANDRIADFRKKYQSLLLRYVPPVTFYLTDIDRAMIVDVRKGAEAIDLPEKECVVSLSSQAAFYTFTTRFGLPTLGVSGRFRINHTEKAFARLKKVGSAYSSGFYTKRPPRFGFKPRLFSFWWRRRADVIPQFVKRIS